VIERGRQIFQRADVGCPTCHAGTRFQSQGSFDVGTGALLQIPSLRGVVYRAPLLHDGCASNLMARFIECGGGDRHGHTSQLTSAELADLVQYLESL
jgi:cytochrome c peroxidase